MRRWLSAVLVCLLLGSTSRADDTPSALVFEPVGELTGHAMVRTLAFSPDGSLLVSGGPDRTLRTWSATERKGLGTLTLPSSKG